MTSRIECNIAEDARTRRRHSNDVKMAIEERVRENDKRFMRNSGLTLAMCWSTCFGKFCLT